jgi:hypothetical protein
VGGGWQGFRAGYCARKGEIKILNFCHSKALQLPYSKTDFINTYILSGWNRAFRCDLRFAILRLRLRFLRLRFETCVSKVAIRNSLTEKQEKPT